MPALFESVDAKYAFAIGVFVGAIATLVFILAAAYRTPR